MPDSRYIPASVKSEVRRRDGGRCTLCGSPEDLQYDHIYPWVLGGSSKTAENIRLLCRSCNSSKSAKVYGEGERMVTPEPGAIERWKNIPVPSRTSFLGTFFLGSVSRQWQGVIIAEPSPQHYLVQCFSWLHGSPSDGYSLVSLADMSGWTFYDTAEEMVSHYETCVHYAWDRHNKSEEQGIKHGE